MGFDFATAGRVLFGTGRAREIAELVSGMGRSALVVTGRTPGRAAFLLEDLARLRVAVSSVACTGEPDLQTVRDAVAVCLAGRCEAVVALGGGSVLDLGKAVACLATNGGDPLDYLEVVGGGAPILRPSLPLIAAPTTAGTGSEVTRNAVLSVEAQGVKASLRSPLMLPAVAVVDPELTLGLPPDVTAASGMDALTQLVEPFVCTRHNPMTDALCRDGIALAARSLRQAFTLPGDLGARTDMALASLFGGLALANAGLGAAHGIAAVLGGAFHVPHGVACARLVGPVTRANLEALRRRSPESAALARYEEVARLLNGSGSATAAHAADWLEALCLELQIPPLYGWGVSKADFAAIAEKSLQASSMKANPVRLEALELVGILAREAGLP